MTQLLKINTHNVAKQTINLCMFGLLTLAPFMQCAGADDARRILKWKDDKNVTHYGDSVPPQYADRENSVISKQGITLQRNKPANHQDQTQNLAKQEQDKKDKALLRAFTSEDEIDLARDRNLQLDQVTVEGLQLQKTNSQKRLAENQKYADSFTKTRKTIPADLAADIKANQLELARQEQQISDRIAAMEATRKRFDDDKKRYIALKNPVGTNTASSETLATVKD